MFVINYSIHGIVGPLMGTTGLWDLVELRLESLRLPEVLITKLITQIYKHIY